MGPLAYKEKGLPEFAARLSQDGAARPWRVRLLIRRARRSFTR
jgi:hypothetical protein